MEQQMENATFLFPCYGINNLSTDPKCLNLTQKYLIINILPFLSFVSSTLEETRKVKKILGWDKIKLPVFGI